MSDDPEYASDEEFDAVFERTLPGPDDDSVRSATAWLVLAEFTDTNGDRQFVWQARDNMSLWQAAGMLHWALARVLAHATGGDPE